jgi:hypothetical protein
MLEMSFCDINFEGFIPVMVKFYEIPFVLCFKINVVSN